MSQLKTFSLVIILGFLGAYNASAASLSDIRKQTLEVNQIYVDGGGNIVIFPTTPQEGVCFADRYYLSTGESLDGGQFTAEAHVSATKLVIAAALSGKSLKIDYVINFDNGKCIVDRVFLKL